MSEKALSSNDYASMSANLYVKLKDILTVSSTQQ